MTDAPWFKGKSAKLSFKAFKQTFLAPIVKLLLNISQIAHRETAGNEVSIFLAEPNIRSWRFSTKGCIGGATYICVQDEGVTLEMKLQCSNLTPLLCLPLSAQMLSSYSS